MSDIKLFKNSSFGSIRIVMQGADPWFVAKDVCDCLEIRVDNAMLSLDDDEKQILSGEQFLKTQNSCTPYSTGSQENSCSPTSTVYPSGINIVSESGFYSLVLRSRKTEAKQFKRWVTHEVLPSIRKTGIYSSTPQTYLEALKQCVALEEARIAAEQEKQKAQIALQEEQSAHLGTQSQLSITTDAYIAQSDQLCQVATATVSLMEQLGLAGGYTKCAAVRGLGAYFTNASSTSFLSALGNYMRELSNEIGVTRKRVPDPVWKTVWAYSDTAWEEFFTRCNNKSISVDTPFIGKFWKE